MGFKYAAIEELRTGVYRINSFGAVEFYYGAKPKPLFTLTGSTKYDLMGKIVIDRIEPISLKNVELRTEISDIHESLKHGEHFDIEDRIRSIENIKIPQLNDIKPLKKLHFSSTGDLLD